LDAAQQTSPVLLDGPTSVLGECPVWDPLRRALIYLDYAKPRATLLDDRTGRATSRALPLRAPLGGLCRRRGGGYLILNPDGVHLMNDELEIVATLCAAHPSFPEAPPNDVCVDAEGRLLVATADRLESRPNAGLLLLASGGVWHQLLTGFTVANGPAFSPDGATLYLADSPRREIYAFSADLPHLALSHRRTLAPQALRDGLPDGLAVDAAGALWSARWDGGAVLHCASDGTSLSRIDLPARRVTSCAFGGEDLSSLFITTAIDETSPNGDLGGHVFKLKVSRTGVIPPSAVL
jgi:xylono-1,5-lactonase